MTRRGVLTGAAALAGVTALPDVLNSAQRRPISHAVLDERLAHSAQFAHGVNALRTHRVNALDDLCSRWYTQLRRQVLTDAGHIAGLTSWIDYMVMRDCAAEIGYARAFHAEHAAGTQGAWAHALGAALASGAHLRSRFVPAEVFSATTAAASSGQVRMVSWVFSPRT